MSEQIARVAGLHDAIGGIIRCEECGWARNVTPERVSRYMAVGWPKCCDYTMRWWTQRQIDAGEMPDL